MLSRLSLVGVALSCDNNDFVTLYMIIVHIHVQGPLGCTVRNLLISLPHSGLESTVHFLDHHFQYKE